MILHLIILNLNNIYMYLVVVQIIKPISTQDLFTLMLILYVTGLLTETCGFVRVLVILFFLEITVINRHFLKCPPTWTLVIWNSVQLLPRLCCGSSWNLLNGFKYTWIIMNCYQRSHKLFPNLLVLAKEVIAVTTNRFFPCLVVKMCVLYTYNI